MRVSECFTFLSEHFIVLMVRVTSNSSAVLKFIYFFQQQPIDFFIRRRILDLSANRNFTAMSAEFEAEAEAMAKAEQRAAEVYFLD